MEENSDCKHCKILEEAIYWKHFNSLHFCQTLTSGFQEHLVLPETFAAHVTAQLPNKVSLKGPSGALWEIELLKSVALLFAGDGWIDFVGAHNLKENFLLMFKFNRNLSFEVLIFDQETSCEKEATYFVKNCRHAKTDHEVQRKRTAGEASSTEIVEDDAKEDPALVASKKCRKDDEAVLGAGEKVNTHIPRKRVLYARAKYRGRRRSALQPQKFPRKPQVQSRNMPLRTETAKKPSEILERDVIILEDGESSPDKDHPHKSKPQSKKQPARSDAPNEPSQTSECNMFITENADSIHDLEEKRPSRSDTPKEATQIIGKELYIPENGNYSSDADCSHRIKCQEEKELTENCTVKGREVIISNNRGSSSEDHILKYHRRRGKTNQEGLPETSKKLVFKSGVTEKRKSASEYMSNRRAVTEKEKGDALKRANKKQNEDSFTSIMRPTSVYKAFFLNIPAKWLKRHHLKHNQEVVLRVGEKTWLTKFCDHGANIQGSEGLGGGLFPLRIPWRSLMC